MRGHIWALVALAGVAAAAGVARAQADPKAVVAVANGRKVTLGEVDALLRTRQLPADTTEADLTRLRYEAACMLVDGILWEQYLQKNGPKIDKAEVDRRLAELAAIVKKAEKSMDDYYKETGQSEASVRAGIVSVLQWDAIARSKVSDAQVRRYFDEHPDYFSHTLVHASHIVYKVAPDATAEQKQEARKNLLAIRANVAAGTIDFAEAARRFSQDATAKDGGDLGPAFPRHGFMPEGIAKAAFGLPVGGVSDVVESEYGLHLIKVTGRELPKSGQPPTFEEVKDEVREVCSQNLRQATMQQLRQAVNVKFNLPR
jgi:peptidyl-prolyl cis-trans isomerase C